MRILVFPKRYMYLEGNTFALFSFAKKIKNSRPISSFLLQRKSKIVSSRVVWFFAIFHHFMSHITLEQIQHLAKLARLELSDEQATSLMWDMESILDMVSQLDEVDVSDVQDAWFAHTQQRSIPQDGVDHCDADLLSNVKHPVRGRAIRV